MRMIRFLRNSITGKNDPSYRIEYHKVSAMTVTTMIVVTVVTLIAVFWFTQVVRDKTIQYNRRVMNTYAKLWSLELSRSLESPEMSILFEEIIEKADYPIVATNSEGEPYFWRNLPVAEDDTSVAAVQEVKKWLEHNRKRFPPIAVYIPGYANVLAYIYFGESPVLRWLRLIPAAQAFVMVVLFALGMLIYRRIRFYEQQNIWLGLAKEAAHQLGTPTSSLLGWITLMRESIAERDLEELTRIADEMDKDVQNMSRTVVRFGQIGSIPELSALEPIAFAREIASYFRGRLPHLANNIELVEHFEPVSLVRANKLLLSWALENLIKNSVEALTPKGGTITVAVRPSLQGNEVHFVVSDNGKGIPVADWKRIFSPGFTTKKRGWGIGLSLTQRIVNDYHHGRLFLLESRPYEKTTFIIALPEHKSETFSIAQQ